MEKREKHDFFEKKKAKLFECNKKVVPLQRQTKTDDKQHKYWAMV